MSFAATLRRSARGSASTHGPPKAAPFAFAPSQSGGLVDHVERRLVALLRGRAPGEEAVAAEHHALHVRIVFGHRAELQPEIKARPLPRQKADLAAVDLFRQRFGVLARRDGNDRIGMHVVNMRCGTKACNGVSIEVARGLRLKVQ